MGITEMDVGIWTWLRSNPSFCSMFDVTCQLQLEEKLHEIA